MKKQDIEVGGKYVVKTSDNLVTVRVESITAGTVYEVTILSSGRKTTFRSTAKFLRVAHALDPIEAKAH